MAEKQKLFWISKKSSYGKGKNALGYGDEIEGVIPEELYDHFVKTGEIGSIEMAKPENVEVAGALELKLKAAEDKLIEYQVFGENAIKVLKQDKLKKEDKESLVSELEALQ